MISRDDLGSWLEGPKPGPQGQDYPGQRLGRPENGAGSIAGLGRRIVALLIDWAASSLIAAWLLPQNVWGPLLVFAVVNLLLVGTTGGTPGHRLLGMRVVRLDGSWAGPLRAALRTVLLCLVLPAVVWDADRRGGHDMAAGTVLVRTR